MYTIDLKIVSMKVCPALAMGNTIVLKPATYTRLSALLFAEICAEAGLPPGVFNVLLGSGVIGSDLADHADVDKVAFTGSTPIGRVLRRRIAGRSFHYLSLFFVPLVCLSVFNSIHKKKK